MRTLLLAISLTLLAAAPAAAQGPKFLIDSRTGEPRAIGAEAWRVCPPNEECGTSMFQVFGNLPAGTRVEALAGGAVVAAKTWGGPVVATAPPSFVGEARSVAAVTPVAGAWSGGWGDETDQLQIGACRAPDSTDCRWLRARPGMPAGALLVWPGMTHFFLRVRNQRIPRDGVVARFGADLLTSWSQGVPIGRMTPQVELRRRASRSSNGYGVGTVRCEGQCNVQATVTSRGRVVTHSFTHVGRRMIVIPREKRLRPSLLRVRVAVDGVVRADGFVRLAR